MNKFRKGDKVTIVGTIKHNQGDDIDKNVFIEIAGYHSDVWINPELVTLVQPSFEIGDECTWMTNDAGGYGVGGTILAIRDGHAWIDMGGGAYCTRLLSTIQRVDSDD